LAPSVGQSAPHVREQAAEIAIKMIRFRISRHLLQYSFAARARFLFADAG
jgi:hypothetical protein